MLGRKIGFTTYVKTVSSNATIIHCFTHRFALCAKILAPSICPLYYTEVHWLSRSNATRHLFELRNELFQFFRKKNDNFQADLGSKEFLARLAYLSDIFEVLNNFNMPFQGPNGTLSKYISKLEAFLRKLTLWMENVKTKKYAVFKLFTSVEDKPNNEFSEEIVCHLLQLKK